MVILPRVAGRSAVSQVGASIGARVALPYRIDGVELQMTASIGLSIYPDQAQTAAGLMNHADESMYRAKAYPGDADGRVARPASPARRRDDR